MRRANSELHAQGSRVNLQLLELFVPQIDDVVELIDKIREVRRIRKEPQE